MIIEPVRAAVLADDVVHGSPLVGVGDSFAGRRPTSGARRRRRSFWSWFSQCWPLVALPRPRGRSSTVTPPSWPRRDSFSSSPAPSRSTRGGRSSRQTSDRERSRSPPAAGEARWYPSPFYPDSATRLGLPSSDDPRAVPRVFVPFAYRSSCSAWWTPPLWRPSPWRPRLCRVTRSACASAWRSLRVWESRPPRWLWRCRLLPEPRAAVSVPARPLAEASHDLSAGCLGSMGVCMCALARARACAGVFSEPSGRASRYPCAGVSLRRRRGGGASHCPRGCRDTGRRRCRGPRCFGRRSLSRRSRSPSPARPWGRSPALRSSSSASSGA